MIEALVILLVLGALAFSASWAYRKGLRAAAAQHRIGCAAAHEAGRRVGWVEMSDSLVRAVGRAEARRISEVMGVFDAIDRIAKTAKEADQ
jgi:hypothetical protein